MARVLTLSLFLVARTVVAQPYASYFTGNTTDMVADALGGVCMMGGATEHDSAMAWFLARANGGDVLVLRASGSDGYNDYMYSGIGGVNSVETIVFNNATAAADPHVLERIDRAEAIWFAGGDQWNYVDYWRGNEVAARINEGIAQRNIAIGGTSAGMAILGSFYFSAQNGSVTSSSALNDPYGVAMTVDDTPFLSVPHMAGVITDTHYDDPDRRGRHTAFLARMITDHGVEARGIACNEYVAVTIDQQGIAHVYGEWPDYEEYAFFLQVNCVEPREPEICTPGSPITWSRDGQAVKVYRVPGLMQGDNWFDLNDWSTGSGGGWEHWTVRNGVFSAQTGTALDCSVGVNDGAAPEVGLRWDAERREARLTGLPAGAVVQAFAADGRVLPIMTTSTSGADHMVRIQHGAQGVVLLRAVSAERTWNWKVVPGIP